MEKPDRGTVMLTLALILSILIALFVVYACSNREYCSVEPAEITIDKSTCSSAGIYLLDYYERHDNVLEASGELTVRYRGKELTCFEGEVPGESVIAFCEVGTYESIIRIETDGKKCLLREVVLEEGEEPGSMGESYLDWESLVGESLVILANLVVTVLLVIVILSFWKKRIKLIKTDRYISVLLLGVCVFTGFALLGEVSSRCPCPAGVHAYWLLAMLNGFLAVLIILPYFFRKGK